MASGEPLGSPEGPPRGPQGVQDQLWDPLKTLQKHGVFSKNGLSGPRMASSWHKKSEDSFRWPSGSPWEAPRSPQGARGTGQEPARSAPGPPQAYPEASRAAPRISKNLGKQLVVWCFSLKLWPAACRCTVPLSPTHNPPNQGGVGAPPYPPRWARLGGLLAPVAVAGPPGTL